MWNAWEEGELIMGCQESKAKIVLRTYSVIDN